MKVVIHGSELSAATAAAALSWVGHDVCWQPLDRHWSELKDSDWLIREPSVLQHLTEAMEAGHLDPRGGARGRWFGYRGAVAGVVADPA